MNMMTKAVANRLTGSLALTLSMMATMPTAHAGWDRKNVNVASQCAAYGSQTATTTILRKGMGLYNAGYKDSRVICPLLRDAEGNWTDAMANAAWVNVYFIAGAMPGHAQCTVLVADGTRSNMATTVTVSMPSDMRPPHGSGMMSGVLVDPPNANAETTSAYMVCTLTPQVTLDAVALVELGKTSTP